ncbi:MAG TPA: hypothetical protein VMI54_28030 [Polyangiaceae bacterium]|nr:hypothetical protein [Polyangiaceae bacterium]
MLEDPLGIDRELRAVARSLDGFRAALRAGRGEDHAFELVGRRVSRELVTALADELADPLAPALLRWAAHLFEEHALAELHVAHAAAFRVARHPLDAPERGDFTLRELLGHALADTKGQRAAWLRVLFERAERATDLALRRAERRAEVRASLAERVPAVFLEGGAPALEAAHRFLDASHGAFAALGVETFADVLGAGLGRDSHAAWPARVTSRSVAELFREGRFAEFVANAPDLALPALGASSFLRALQRFGAALPAGLAGDRAPFALARDPYGFDRATFGALFALLPANAAFARRALGVGAAGAADHRRTLARVLLVASREAALRAVLHDATFGGRRALEAAYAERSFGALGVELPARAFGVVFTPRPSDVARLAGLFTATELAARLVDEHDEDWYRNPRAVEEIRELARQPAAAAPDPETLERGRTALVALVEAAL